nr:hypothetical protein CFP56_71669 [Quercus suber]
MLGGCPIEQDQQFGGWLRAPTTLPRKCSVVKVEGHNKEDAREVTQPPVALTNEDKDNNEENDQGVSRSDVVPIGPGRSKGVTEDRMDTSEHLSVELGRNNKDFQEILNEINVGLSKCYLESEGSVAVTYKGESSIRRADSKMEEIGTRIS